MDKEIINIKNTIYNETLLQDCLRPSIEEKLLLFKVGTLLKLTDTQANFN